MAKNLIVSEIFASIQGEGCTMGYPSIFLRLAGCNLTCGISRETFSKSTKQSWRQSEIEKNKLPEATWVCDTISVWRKGVPYVNKDLLHFMNVLCDFETKINRGWHLVITGGEPLLQEEALEEFLQFLEDLGILPYIEIETNCTIIPQNKKFIKRVTNWNVSPKLNNSGMPIEVREFARVYKWFNWQRGTIFKYVISTDKDYRAVERLIQSGWIIRNKVWLMPAASSRQELIENNKRVAELAKKNDVKFCTRLQLEIYNRATGV